MEDYKELFLLFDKNEDGLLTISQVCKAVALLGISVSGLCPFPSRNMNFTINLIFAFAVNKSSVVSSN